jgi:hypothetical protein
VRAGRLTALCSAAIVLALVGTAVARLQTHHVTVVSGKGFRLTAWDKRGADKSICFKLQSGKQSGTQCETVVQRKAGVNFTSFRDTHRRTLLGGVARKNVTKVVATFANGKTLTLTTKNRTRYKGRLRGKVRFWAGRYNGTSPLKSLVAKTSSGSQGSPVEVPPPPEPPKYPCPPCHGPPTAKIVCPLTPCPE